MVEKQFFQENWDSMVLKCLYGNVTVKVWDLMVLKWGHDGPEMACSLWRTHLLLQGHLP